MAKLELNVITSVLSKTNQETIVDDSIDFWGVDVTFSADWTDKTKTLIAGKGNEKYAWVLVDNKIAETEHFNLSAGRWVIGIVGVSGTGVVNNTTPLYIDVAQGGYQNGEIPPIPDHDVYLQLLELYQELISGGGSGYILPTMTNLVKGGAKVGTTLKIVEEVLDVSDETIASLEPAINYPLTNPQAYFYNGLGEFAQVSVGSGGYSAPLYYTTLDSDVSGYRVISYEPQPTEVQLDSTIANTEVLLRTYLYPSPIETEIIDAGRWVFTYTAKISNSAGNSHFRAEVFLRHINNSETVLFSSIGQEINNTVFEMLKDETTQPAFTTLPTDRLGIKFYASTDSISSKTLSVIIGDGRGGYFTTPLSIRHSQLRDKNSESGYQHVTQTWIDEVDNAIENIPTYSNATQSVGGLMSSTDKTKLDGIEANANNYSLDNAKLSTVLSGATAETTIEDTDTVPFTDVSVSNSTKKITWANIKARLKTYFDTLYTVISSGSIIADATTLSIELSKYPTIKKTATLTTCTSLTITLPSGANWYDEFVLYFTTSTTPPTVTLPIGIVWVGGTPTFSASKTYIISIQNGIGVVANV